MKSIVHCDGYALAVDAIKNRIYCTLTGPRLPDMTRFVADWEKAALFVSGGFTILVDSSQFQRLPLLWLEMSARAQKALRKAGLIAAAEIMHEDTFQEMSRFNLATVAGLEMQRMFKNKDDAEIWLVRVHKEGKIL